MTDRILVVREPVAQLVMKAPQASTVVVEQEVARITALERQGPPGRPGKNGAPSIATGVAAEPILEGQPVCLNRKTGLMNVAEAGVFVCSFVVGFALDTADAGFPVRYETILLYREDWSVPAGGERLAAGSTYFLGVEPGTITRTPPSQPGQSVARVGIATDEQTLLLMTPQPVLL